MKIFGFNINNKKCHIVVKSDMRDTMHTGQNLRAVWVLNCEDGEAYILQIKVDFSWCLIEKGGNHIDKGDNFLDFLDETNQRDFWEE